MNYIIFFVLMTCTAFIIWFQTVAPIRFPEFLSKYLWVVYLLSLVTGIFFVEASKIGVKLFDTAWALRFLGFAINTIVFGILTYFAMGEGLSTKNAICLGLSLVIVLVQCFVN